jgi:hypothetical protein
VTDEVKAVEFVAEVRQVKTMADGTANVTLNLPEYCIDQAAWFLKHQGDMVKSVSQLENLTILNGDDGNTADKEETKRGAAKLDSRRLRDRRDQRAGR